MTILNQDFKMYAGDSKLVTVTVTDENDTSLDITGVNIEWVVKRNVRSTIKNVYKSSQAGGITITNPLIGEFQIKLDPADTVALSGIFYHEAELTDVQGSVSTLFTGNLTIELSGV